MQLTWATCLEGTLCAPYMTDLPGGDTSCTLHDGLTGGHFMHLTWRTYRGTLRVSYMIMLPGRHLVRLTSHYQRDTSRTLHDQTYLGTLRSP